jgi:ABC-type microcin C transport system permease subunit YejB
MRAAASFRTGAVLAGIGLLVLAAAVNRPLPALGSALAGLTLIGIVLDRRA